MANLNEFWQGIVDRAMKNFPNPTPDSQSEVVEKYNPNQPRVPAGEPGAGEWVGDNDNLKPGEDASETARDRSYTRAQRFIRRWWGTFATGIDKDELKPALARMCDGKRARVRSVASYAAGMAQYVINVEKFKEANPGADPDDDQPAGVIAKYGLERPRCPKWAVLDLGPNAKGPAKREWDACTRLVAQTWKTNHECTKDDIAAIITNMLGDDLGIKPVPGALLPEPPAKP